MNNNYNDILEHHFYVYSNKQWIEVKECPSYVFWKIVYKYDDSDIEYVDCFCDCSEHGMAYYRKNKYFYWFGLVLE